MKTLSPASAAELLAGFPPVGWLTMVDKKISLLTLGEIAALAQLRLGHQDKIIASNLKISIATVRFHLKNASKKVGAKSRLELALWTDRNFWVPGFLQNVALSLSAAS